MRGLVGTSRTWISQWCTLRLQYNAATTRRTIILFLLWHITLDGSCVILDKRLWSDCHMNDSWSFAIEFGFCMKLEGKVTRDQRGRNVPDRGLPSSNIFPNEMRRMWLGDCGRGSQSTTLITVIIIETVSDVRTWSPLAPDQIFQCWCGHVKWIVPLNINTLFSQPSWIYPERVPRARCQ